MSANPKRVIRKGRQGVIVDEMRMSDVPSKKARVGGLRFGSAVVKVRKADTRELAENVARGQAALARAMRALQTPGVKLKRTKGVPLYAADPEQPDHLVRVIDGRRERGVFEDGEFKVTG